MVGLGVAAIFSWAISMAIGQNDQNPGILNILAFIVVTSGFAIIILS